MSRFKLDTVMPLCLPTHFEVDFTKEVYAASWFDKFHGCGTDVYGPVTGTCLLENQCSKVTG